MAVQPRAVGYVCGDRQTEGKQRVHAWLLVPPTRRVTRCYTNKLMAMPAVRG